MRLILLDVPPTDEVCLAVETLDIIFIADMSSSINPADYKKQLQFIQGFVKEFNTTTTGTTRVGLISFR